MGVSAIRTREDDLLHVVPLPNTPDLSTFNLGGSENTAFADYLNANAADILSETHQAPLNLPGNLPFLAGRIESISAFQAKGVDQNLRHTFSLNTCMGCHFSETDTNFRHIQPRGDFGSSLSNVLLNDTFEVPDPVNHGQTLTIDIVERRKAIIAELVNPSSSKSSNAKLQQMIKGNKYRAH